MAKDTPKNTPKKNAAVRPAQRVLIDPVTSEEMTLDGFIADHPSGGEPRWFPRRKDANAWRRSLRPAPASKEEKQYARAIKSAATAIQKAAALADELGFSEKVETKAVDALTVDALATLDELSDKVKSEIWDADSNSK